MFVTYRRRYTRLNQNLNKTLGSLANSVFVFRKAFMKWYSPVVVIVVFVVYVVVVAVAAAAAAAVFIP